MSKTAHTAPVRGGFGKYQLGFKLATGGMAEIFVARRTGETVESDSVVVIKRILPHLADEPRFVRMFRDEARLAALLDHDNICDIHEFGEVGETYYLAMEYLHGVPFSSLMKHSAKTQQYLDVPLLVGIIEQACRGLEYAHELHGEDGHPLHLVHRDLSPPNILITDAGMVKVLDFGVAKARGASDKTRTGTIKGKNSYMSPEQVRGTPVDRRSDVFALGILLFEALTTQRLFKAQTDFLVFQMITDDDLPEIAERRPDLTAELIDVVYRALAQDRDDRFESVAELSAALVQATKSYGPPATVAEIKTFVNEAFREDLDELHRRYCEVVDEVIVVPTPIAPSTESVPLAIVPPQKPQQRERRRLLMALPMAAVLLIVVIWLATRGGDAHSKTAQDHRPDARLAVAAVDAAAAVAPSFDAHVVATTADAGVPDAAMAADASAPDAQSVPVKRGPPGYLSIDSRPYATIYVDGRYVGVTPLHRIKLRSGRRRVRAVSSAGTKRFSLRIRSGKLATKRLSNW